ncbi:MAG: 23S rRNA (uracil(1939)-C(5))-methyltransferase RlmD [Prolixibacteraceae bacterium]|nr:23S rRNA (uracil(1939)-C(5))-methyltransferase RlmD [Prolixibacteraceae bacterium]
MTRKRKKPFYERVSIEDIGSEGKALVKINDMVVFTRHAIPGDIVDLQVIRKRKNYQEAVITRIYEFSIERVKPFCSHFGDCGGCVWQFLPYEKQLFYKQKQVVDQLTRIGKVKLPVISPILASENKIFYRNKLEYTFSTRRWLTREEIDSGNNFFDSDSLGFHASGQFDKVINIEKCWLQPDPSNAIRTYVYQYAIDNGLEFFDIRNQKGFLRTLMIRTSARNEVMVVLSVFRDDREALSGLLNSVKENFPSVTSLMYVINSKGNDTISDLDIMLYYGRDYILEEMENLKFRIGPKSFFQTNSAQAYNLYKVVREFAALTGREIVYDLYTGTGTIAQFIAGNAQKVVGIDYVPSAINDAVINASLNQIDNVFFFTGDIKELLKPNFTKEHGKPDVIITDPPRAGMHKDVIESLLEILPEKIVYVSCNPATQARDINLLSSHYTVIKVQPVDMFPHTQHVENVVLLERVIEQ